MSGQKDKFITPDSGNPNLEGYRNAGKGLIEGEGQDQKDIDDSTAVARQATVPDETINTPARFEEGKIGDQVEVNLGNVRGDFAADEDRDRGSGVFESSKVDGPSAGAGASNTIRDIEDTDNDKSYMPGSGAVRTKEDRLGKGDVDPDSIPPGAGVI